MKIKDLTIMALLTAILFISQVAFAALPNIEFVSFLIVMYTLRLKWKVLYIIYVFALLQGIFYGFGIWFFMYLYVWTILALITILMQKNKSTIIWALISAIFGLSFGFLCSFPYFITGGLYMGLAYWVAGMPYDVTHCIGNFIVMLIFYKPVSSLFNTIFKWSDNGKLT